MASRHIILHKTDKRKLLGVIIKHDIVPVFIAFLFRHLCLVFEIVDDVCICVDLIIPFVVLCNERYNSVGVVANAYYDQHCCLAYQ